MAYLTLRFNIIIQNRSEFFKLLPASTWVSWRRSLTPPKICRTHFWPEDAILQFQVSHHLFIKIIWSHPYLPTYHSFCCVSLRFFSIRQVVILEHKSIICAGYSAVMHIHCAAEEVTVIVSIFYYYFPCLFVYWNMVKISYLKFSSFILYYFKIIYRYSCSFILSCHVIFLLHLFLL